MQKLTPEGCRSRRERLIAATPADVIIVNNPRHIFYLTGMFATELLQSAWGLNALFIDTSSGKTTLVAHNAMGGQVNDASVDEVVSYPWYNSGNAGDAGGDLFGLAVDAIAAQAKDHAGRRFAAERGWFPQAVGISDPFDLNPIFYAMRRQKDADELMLIREALRVNEAAHCAGRAAVVAGATELDVYNAILSAAVQEYGAPIHMLGDFVSGERAAQIGGSPTNRVLKSGEVMILDIFPIVNGYRADFTATVAVDDEVSANQRRLDDALHDAKSAGEAQLKPGTLASDVYHAVRGRLESHGFADSFPHHAGHGLGIDHPEAPYFVPLSTEVLVAGDVVTLEPGAYGADFAARIENNYLITESGFEKMTNHDTRLFSS